MANKQRNSRRNHIKKNRETIYVLFRMAVLALEKQKCDV